MFYKKKLRWKSVFLKSRYSDLQLLNEFRQCLINQAEIDDGNSN